MRIDGWLRAKGPKKDSFDFPADWGFSKSGICAIMRFTTDKAMKETSRIIPRLQRAAGRCEAAGKDDREYIPEPLPERRA